ncbi:MAG: dual CXXC motif small (seleno)protein [Desulfovibrio sp.]|uniref:dual CXXC motif small (seleno)protein n=1 Tax=Desulfovibrio sp. 7SRBS1 TaxID=3378064 RepID=UPI003B40EB43
MPGKKMPDCKQCGRELDFCRACQRIYLYCSHCDRQFDIRDYLDDLPEAVEEAAAMIPMDRI